LQEMPFWLVCLRRTVSRRTGQVTCRA